MDFQGEEGDQYFKPCALSNIQSRTQDAFVSRKSQKHQVCAMPPILEIYYAGLTTPNGNLMVLLI